LIKRNFAANIETMEKAKANIEDKLEEQLRFGTLLSEISARYINLPVDQIDSGIEDDQRLICEFLDLDLSALWQWEEEATRFLTVTHLHSPPEGPSRPEGIDAEQAFPWVLKKMLNGETLVLFTENMLPEAARDQESRRNFGIKSSVVLPLSVGGGPLIGVLTFETLWEERDWPAEIVKRLMLVAQIFSNALVRKESDRLLRQSEARLSLAADSAGTGLWELNFKTNQFWATETARFIFGYGAEEAISMERFEQSVFPDDFALVRQAIARSLDRNESLNVEYRILVSEASMKWIYSSGRPYFKPSGEPDRLLGVSIDITERKNMEEKLRESEATLRNNQKDLQRLAGRLISVKEEELRRLSRELHDDLTQRLAVIAIEAGKLELHLNDEEQSLPESIQKISQIKDQLILVSEDVHRISRQLHPTILDDLGLVRAIESECAALSQRENIEIIFTREDVPERFPDDVPLCLYRLVQEGLNNCICHSGTNTCEVVLKGLEDTIFLAVEDKGMGFNPVEVRDKPGLGLASMRERAQLVGGHFKVETEPGRGTSIHVTIPLKRPEK
jgi:PAS domain S-box-containing protein